MLITPHVVHDQRDARALTEDLREQLIHAAAVLRELEGCGPQAPWTRGPAAAAKAAPGAVARIVTPDHTQERCCQRAS